MFKSMVVGNMVVVMGLEMGIVMVMDMVIAHVTQSVCFVAILLTTPL